MVGFDVPWVREASGHGFCRERTVEQASLKLDALDARDRHEASDFVFCSEAIGGIGGIVHALVDRG